MSVPIPQINIENHHLGEDFRTSLIESVCYALKAQGGVDVKFKDTKVYDSNTFKEPLAIASTIGVVGDNVRGGVALAFPKETFLSLSNQILGEDSKEITTGNQDLAGEFLNITFGKVKSKFKDEKKIPIYPAIPIVLVSTDLRFSFETKEIIYIISFTSSLGNIFAAAAISFTKT